MIGYLGPSGTFSHLAAIEYSGGKEQLTEFPTIYSAIKAADEEKVTASIVPIENSIEGSVNVTLDALAFDSDLYITDEYVLKISQNLLVKKGATKEAIKTVASHPQGIGQCSKLLNIQFPDVAVEYTSSTAEAARLAADSDGSVAVIASKNCANLYDLDVLYSDCGDEENNSTRFVVVAKQARLDVTRHDKTSIVFTLDNKPGALYQALAAFEKSNINLVKIESRPLKKGLGKYVFFIDIEGNIDDPVIYFALDRIRQSTSFYKFLGSYPMFQS
jgi:prephenate dehydratase